MKIKQDKQLHLGDIISWKLSGDITVKIMVNAIYSHFVEFKVLEPPYMSMAITNNELYQRGIYKATDFVNPFARSEDE